MKRIYAIMIALVLVVGLLTACGDDGYDSPADNNANAADSGEADEDAAYGTVETEDGYYQDFEFINNTSETIVELYASAGGAASWLNNMLEGQQVGPEQYVILTIYIIPGDTTDFRIVAENGAEFEMRDYQLENYSTMELTPGDDGEGLLYLS